MLVRLLWTIAASYLLVLSTSLFGLEKSVELYQQGISEAQQANYDDAIALFKQTIEESPYYALAHYALGRAYLYKMDKQKEAIKELRIAVELDRYLAKAHFYLGLAYFLEEEYSYSVSSFNRAYELDENYYIALYNIGAIYDFIGHPNKSLLFYKKYVDEKAKFTMYNQEY